VRQQRGFSACHTIATWLDVVKQEERKKKKKEKKEKKEKNRRKRRLCDFEASFSV